MWLVRWQSKYSNFSGVDRFYLKYMATNNTNLAGEFYAMHVLFRQGYVPALTLGNTKGVDILLYNPMNGKQFKVEVKTSTVTKNEKLFGGQNISWRMDKKHENICEDSLIYCFVYMPLNKQSGCQVFFVASAEVSIYIKWQHEHWLSSAHAKPVQDTEMRNFRISVNEMRTWENCYTLFD